MRTEILWLLVALGIAVFVVVVFVAGKRNQRQSVDGVRRSEQGARDLREEIDRDDT